MKPDLEHSKHSSSRQEKALTVGKTALEWALENNQEIRGNFFVEPHPDKDEDLLDMDYPFQPGHMHLITDHPKARSHLTRYRSQFVSFDAPLKQALQQFPEDAPAFEQYACLLHVRSLLNINKLQHISLLNEMSNMRITSGIEPGSSPLPLFIEQTEHEKKPDIVGILQHKLEQDYTEAKDTLDIEIAICKDKIPLKEHNKIVPLECINAVRDAYANAYLADLTFLQLNYEQGMIKGAKLSELQKEHFNDLQLNYAQLNMLEDKLKEEEKPNLRLYTELENQLKQHRQKLQQYGQRFENNRAYSNEIAQQTRYWLDFERKVEAFFSSNDTIRTKLTTLPHLLQPEQKHYRDGGFESPIPINFQRGGYNR